MKNQLTKLFIYFSRHKKISFFGILITFITMWYFSSLPGNSVSVPFSWMAIVYHFSIFSIFAFFVLSALAKKNSQKTEFILTILITIIFAVLDELHQSFVPFRNAGIQDVLVDTLGAFFSALIFTSLRE